MGGGAYCPPRCIELVSAEMTHPLRSGTTGFASPSGLQVLSSETGRRTRRRVPRTDRVAYRGGSCD